MNFILIYAVLWFFKVSSDSSTPVMVIDSSGTLLTGPAQPNLSNLFDFLKAFPEYTAILPNQPSRSVSQSKFLPKFNIVQTLSN